jgi:hypothetical protein
MVYTSHPLSATSLLLKKEWSGTLALFTSKGRNGLMYSLVDHHTRKRFAIVLNIVQLCVWLIEPGKEARKCHAVWSSVIDEEPLRGSERDILTTQHHNRRATNPAELRVANLLWSAGGHSRLSREQCQRPPCLTLFGGLRPQWPWSLAAISSKWCRPKGHLQEVSPRLISPA